MLLMITVLCVVQSIICVGISCWEKNFLAAVGWFCAVMGWMAALSYL